MTPIQEFAKDVREGLSRLGQKELPTKYLYDAVGSSLFETICLLPEYGVTRAGFRLLERHSADLADHLRTPFMVAELGSGAGRKTRLLLEELAKRSPVTYYPIDVSGTALQMCAAELAGFDRIRTIPVEATYDHGLARVTQERSGQPLLVLFLGGTIGNFSRQEAARFLRMVREALVEGDHLLLAADLEKPTERLLAAYDDPIGVTAAFNLNVLSRINHELGGNFDLEKFEHQARWDDQERRVEMHLRSRVEQVVTIPAADLRVDFRAGETIWTESSYRYSCQEIVRLGEGAGFGCSDQWVDQEWPFAQTLLRAR